MLGAPTCHFLRFEQAQNLPPTSNLINRQQGPYIATSIGRHVHDHILTLHTVKLAQDESEVEKEASSTPEAQEKKDESQKVRHWPTAARFACIETITDKISAANKRIAPLSTATHHPPQYEPMTSHATIPQQARR